jgi:hypothetical protein
MYVLQREIGPTTYTKIIIELPMPFVGGDSESSLSFTKNKSVFSCPSFYAKGPAAKPQEPLNPFLFFRIRLSTNTLRRQQSRQMSSE